MQYTRLIHLVFSIYYGFCYIYSYNFKDIIYVNYITEYDKLDVLSVGNDVLSNFYENNHIITNNIGKEEAFLVKLYLNNLPLSINTIEKRQFILKGFLGLLNTLKIDINDFNYDSSTILRIIDFNFENIKSCDVVEILNDLIDFIFKYRLLLSFIKESEILSYLFYDEICYFDYVFNNKFNDDMLNEALRFIFNCEKIKDVILFNKNYKIKYLYSFSRNFEILSKLIYNYYKITLFLKISNNVMRSNKEFTFVLLKLNPDLNYFTKLKNDLKNNEKVDLIVVFGDEGKLNFRHFYKINNVLKYPQEKILENLIFGLFIGITFDL